jgi:hypothetical protein
MQIRTKMMHGQTMCNPIHEANDNLDLGGAHYSLPISCYVMSD